LAWLTIIKALLAKLDWPVIITSFVAIIIIGITYFKLKSDNRIRIIPIGILVISLSFAMIASFSFKNKYYKTREAEVKKLENNTKIAENQFENIVTLNRNILDLILKSYEGYILNAINQADAIRQLVCDVLVKSYSKYPNIKIHVVPLTEKGYSLLDSKTAAFVRLLALENKPLSIIEDDTIGISIIHGFDDLSTAIIIDTTDLNYEISDAEICSASTLFVSIANTIQWAVQVSDGKNEIQHV